MKYAIFSDAHGNKIYFEKCLDVIDELKVDRLFYLGDMFGYMPDGMSVMRELLNRGADILKGNHEAMLTGEIPLDLEKNKIYGLEQQRRLLSTKDMSFLERLEDHLELETENGKILFLHGAPFDALNGYLYEDNQEYSWDGDGYRFIFMGHTHRAYIKQSIGTTFVNVGSCGLPRDHGLSPGFCIFDIEDMIAKIIRIQVHPQIIESDYFSKVNDKVMEVLRRK